MSDIYKLSDKVREKSLVSLSVYNVGRQKCTPGYEWGPGVRDHYLIHLITSGKGTYTINDKTYSLSAGDLFAIFPDTVVRYRADRKDPWEYQWVGFSGTDSASIMESSALSPSSPVIRSLSCNSELKEQLKKIHSAFGNSYYDALQMTGELYLALSLLIRDYGHRRDTEDAALYNVRKSISYMESHYSYDISIDDVASFTGVSRSTLYRQFMKALNISPKEYLDDFRIRRASLLLKETSLPVCEVAASVGIQNNLYFSRTFKKHTGMSPVDYRRTMR